VGTRRIRRTLALCLALVACLVALAVVPVVATGGTTPPRGGITPVPKERTLPNTGLDLGLAAVLGLALVGSGFLLRLLAREA
jgi:LPXTG-motif cell wall-anchored protein